MSPKIVILAAHGRNREIGKDNTLPWNIPAEMKHFKRSTIGRTVLMGRKTAQSLGGALKNRTNLVLTHGDTAPYRDMIPVASLEEALEHVEGSELVIIGGEQVYRQFIDRADKIVVSYISIDVEGADAFFPEINLDIFEQTGAEPHLSEMPDTPDFAIWTFERKDRS